MDTAEGISSQGKGIGDFKDDVSPGEMHSLKAQKQFSPLLCLSKNLQGANNGSTWGWLLLEGVKNPKMIFEVGQMPDL